ncbi:hypothetical protein PFISCL1PPCAC_14750, partial [Pristionchus fissidentatus]
DQSQYQQPQYPSNQRSTGVLSYNQNNVLNSNLRSNGGQQQQQFPQGQNINQQFFRDPSSSSSSSFTQTPIAAPNLQATPQQRQQQLQQQPVQHDSSSSAAYLSSSSPSQVVYSPSQLAQSGATPLLRDSVVVQNQNGQLQQATRMIGMRNPQQQQPQQPQQPQQVQRSQPTITAINPPTPIRVCANPPCAPSDNPFFDMIVTGRRRAPSKAYSRFPTSTTTIAPPPSIGSFLSVLFPLSMFLIHLFLLIFTVSASPLLRIPTVSDSPQKGRYFVSSAPVSSTALNDARQYKTSYLDILSPRLFLKSMRQEGKSSAASPFNSPDEYFSRKSYSAYGAGPVAPAVPAAQPVYAPQATAIPVLTVTTFAQPPNTLNYQYSAPAHPAPQPQPTVVAAAVPAAPAPSAAPVYKVPAPIPAPVYAPAPAPILRSPIVASPVYATPVPVPVMAPVSAPVLAAPAPLPVPVDSPRPVMAAPTPLYVAPVIRPAILPPQIPFFAPRAMTIPLPTVTVAAAAPAAVPPLVAAAPAAPAHVPFFSPVPQSLPSSIYPSQVVVPPSPVPLPAAAPIFSPAAAAAPVVPSSPIYYHSDSA